LGKIFIGILLVFLALAAPVRTQAEVLGEGVSEDLDNLALKVLTLNIHGAVNWFGQFDLDGIIHFIEEVNPDIVGLQEVDRNWSNVSNFEDLPLEMATRLKMFYAYSASLERNGGNFGNLILSKHPFTQIWTQNLPGNLEQRSVVFAQFIINGVRINFLTTHLGLSEADRLAQSAAIVQLANQVDGPLIITGDFNGDGADPSIAPLRSNFLDLLDQSDFRESGTFRAKDGNISSRIDFILTTPEFGVSRVQIFDNYISDHLPVLVEVNLLVDRKNMGGEPVFTQSTFF
jgi:endonuclease/exonuclease/phosphatase family metal-dependent hydrolase